MFLYKVMDLDHFTTEGKVSNFESKKYVDQQTANFLTNGLDILIYYFLYIFYFRKMTCAELI